MAPKKKTKPKPPKIRYTWTRRPVEVPHTTKKGGKGYSRTASKKRLTKELRED